MATPRGHQNHETQPEQPHKAWQKGEQHQSKFDASALWQDMHMLKSPEHLQQVEDKLDPKHTGHHSAKVEQAAERKVWLEQQRKLDELTQAMHKNHRMPEGVRVAGYTAGQEPKLILVDTNATDKQKHIYVVDGKGKVEASFKAS